MEEQSLAYTLEQLIAVNITENKLEAYIRFLKLDGNIQLKVSDLEEYLHQHGIKYGIRRDVLAQIAENPAKFKQASVLVAAGDPPQNGRDGEIRLLVDMDGKIKPMELEDGTVDFREIRTLNNVQKGQPLAERIPPTEGVPGRAVTGDVIAARNGKEAMFKVGKNVVVNLEKTMLYAAIDGLLTKTDIDKLNVFPVYEVNGDVDYSVGNIDFNGTVVIRGNVLPGFKVKAAGDIRVIGGVEAGELEAGGSIEITGGILGQNKAYVRAGKLVKSSFIQDARVEAMEDVIVSQSIMHSQIRAGFKVVCHGAKGLIVGGVIQAGEKVKARTIGNTTSTPTSIEVGMQPELRQELYALRARYLELKTNLDKTEKALALLDQMALTGQLSPDKMAMRSKLSATKRAAQNEMEQTKERMMEIEIALEDSFQATVEVTSTVYAGTKIVIGRYTRFIKDSVRAVRFCVREGEIAMVGYTERG
jgi:hypothetical protein